MKKSFTIVTLIFVILLVVAGGGVYYFMYGKLLQNTKQGSILQEEVARESGEEDATRALRSSIQGTAKEQALLKSLFLGRDESAFLIEKIEGTATVAHVSHTLTIDARQDDKLAAQNKELIITSIKVAGTWSQVYHFISLLENFPYKVNILEVRLDRGDVPDLKTKEFEWSASIAAQFIKEK